MPSLRNPYIADRPLTESDLYHGRENAFGHLRAALARGTRLFLLHGPRYLGKTSFLNQLPLRFSRYVTRRIEWSALGGGQGDPLWRLLMGVAHALGVTEPDQAACTSDSEYATQYLGRILSGADPRSHLLCFDTIPGSEVAKQQRWDDALVSLAAAVATEGSLALLLSIERSPAEEDLPPSFACLQTIPLVPLKEAEAEDLLTLPARGSLSYDYGAVRYMYRLSGGAPYLVQVLARMLFDRRAAVGSVGRPEVEQVAQELSHLGLPQFQDQWDHSEAPVQLVMAAIADMRGGSGPKVADDVVLYYRQMRLEIPREDLEQALHNLVEREILDPIGGETYRFRSELFRYWLKAHKSTECTLRENRRYAQHRLGRITPPRSRRVDWLGLALWSAAGLLVLLIALVWRSRDTTIVFTGKPTAASAAVSPAGLPVTPELPTPERGVAPGHIAFMAKEQADQKWDIYTMRSDGSDPIRLSDSGANDTSPSWSPDARHIAFVSDRDGNREVYVMNADGNAQINLTNHAAGDWTPSWSPDGRHIAFASFRDGNWEIYVVEADGSDPQRLTDNTAADYSPRWSPDGSRFVFVSDRDGNLEIYVMQADGSAQTRITQHEATDQNPIWSTDGETLLWESYRENNMEIFAARVDGSEMGPLSRDAYADDHGPTMSPWGNRIAFYSNRDQGWDIYTLDLETGERVNLTQSPEIEQAPHWGR